MSAAPVATPEHPPLPDGRFGVIYADPPWKYETWSAKGQGRNAEAWYETLTVPEIMALPIAPMAERGFCALYLWAPACHTPAVAEVMEAWGFRFSTLGINWVKTYPGRTIEEWGERAVVKGIGPTVALDSEQCWLGFRGVGAKNLRLDRGVRQTLFAPRTKVHSEKPAEACALIERLYPGPYIELFSRSTRAGWTVWGKEAGILDAGMAPKRRWKSNSYPGAPESAPAE